MISCPGLSRCSRWMCCMIRVSMGIPGQRPGAIDARLGDGSEYCSDAVKEDVVGVIRWPTSEVDTF